MRLLLWQFIHYQIDTMKRKIILLIVTLILVVGAFTVYQYLYKDHRSIATEVSVVTVDADQLQQFFTTAKGDDILNKTVTVSGAVTQIEGNTITLDDMVNCSFDADFKSIAKGDKIQVKGRCIGYDELFEQVQLDQSTITNTK